MNVAHFVSGVQQQVFFIIRFSFGLNFFRSCDFSTGLKLNITNSDKNSWSYYDFIDKKISVQHWALGYFN